jgi:hypothetical protein
LHDAGALAVEEIDRLIRTDRGRPDRDREPRESMVTLLQPTLVVRDSSRPVAAASPG